MLTIRHICGETYHVEESHIGKSVRCTRCGVVFQLLSTENKRIESPGTWRDRYLLTARMWMKLQLRCLVRGMKALSGGYREGVKQVREKREQEPPPTHPVRNLFGYFSNRTPVAKILKDLPLFRDQRQLRAIQIANIDSMTGVDFEMYLQNL